MEKVSVCQRHIEFFFLLFFSIESKNVDEKPDDLCPSESKKSKILGTPKIKAKTNRFKWVLTLHKRSFQS